MDLRVFLATLTAIFMAELADKTQLVGISMSAKSGKPLTVWLGSVAGYMLVTGISVILGTMFAKFMNASVIRYAGSFVFIAMGILMFFGKV